MVGCGSASIRQPNGQRSPAAAHDCTSGRLVQRVLDRVFGSGPSARLCPALPAGWMLASVDRQYHHCGISHAKVNRVGEARQHGTTSLSTNPRKMKGTGRNALDDSVQFFAELSPQTDALRLIPLAHFQRLVFGLWPEDNFQRHVQPWSLARTSAHGMADFGFFRCSAQRRSSSARSASDSSNAPSRSASLRLSHKAIASSARSPAGSLSSSVRGLDAMTRSSHGQPRGAIQPPSCARATLSSPVIGLACFQRSNYIWSRPLHPPGGYPRWSRESYSNHISLRARMLALSTAATVNVVGREQCVSRARSQPTTHVSSRPPYSQPPEHQRLCRLHRTYKRYGWPPHIADNRLGRWLHK